MRKYRVVTHAGRVYVESMIEGTHSSWQREQEHLGSFCLVDREFFTQWGARRWCRKQVRKEEVAKLLAEERKKSPVVVWGPYP